MDVYLDHDPMPTDQQTLAGVLVEGRRRATAAGRMIVEVRLDGRVLDHAEIEQRAHQPLDAEELQLVTSDPLQLAGQALDDVADALEQARGWQQEAAELLRTDRSREAMEQIQLVFNVWTQVTEALDAAGRLLRLDLDRLEIGGEPIRESVHHLTARLRAAGAALTGNDWLGLADVLGYELDSIIDRWLTILRDLRGRIPKA